MNYALVRNGQVAFAANGREALSRYIRETDGVSVSLPENLEASVTVAGYDILPVTVTSYPAPSGRINTGEHEYVVNGGIVERRDATQPMTLNEVINDKTIQIDAAYSEAIQQPVAYMGTLFQADKDSQDVLLATLTTLNPLGATPPGFWWKDVTNNHIPMTLAELQGLGQTMFAQGWVAFQNRDAKKAQVTAATSEAEVSAVTW